jgi:hypothetical protein
MPEVQLYDQFVEIADSADGFERSIEICLKKTEADLAARIAAMKMETWEAKLEKINLALVQGG